MDVTAYLERIGYDGPVEPSLECLRGVHLAQALGIPYENLDVQLEQPLDQDIEKIFEKIVTRRRGGWCYELNGLLGWALREIGFDVARVTAGMLREERGDAALGNHLVLLVRLDRPWIADLGMGDGIREPIPLEVGLHRQGGLTFSLEEAGDGYWRFRNHAFAYPPNFDFREDPADEELLEATCARLQVWPESTFVQNLICQIMERDAITCLTGRVLRRKTAADTEKTLLNSSDELARTLDEVFGIRGVDVARLWAKAVDRHELLFGERPVEEIDVAGM